MSIQDVTSELLFDLSDVQQELVAGGGPTLGLVQETSQYIKNQAPVYSTVSAGPNGATANGFAQPAELNSLATQLSLGTAGIPNLTLPHNIASPDP